jgi:hypothetical protein
VIADRPAEGRWKRGRAGRPSAREKSRLPGKYASLSEQADFTEEWLDSFSEAIQITPERVWAMP